MPDTRTAIVFQCAQCQDTFYVRGAHVQADGSLRCRKCSQIKGLADAVDWCPLCREAKPYRAFEPDDHPSRRGYRARWCLECAAAQKESASPAKVCEHCGNEFLPARRDARFCSGRCRVAAHRRR
jgi:hypothetical protein